MKRNMQILLLFLFIFTIAACIPVPVVVGPQSAGYEDQYGYGYGYDDEYVDVPIAYGEPYYFAPPIVVTYPYDYYTYEMVDGFVDIVFWRGGHRYRHERWHDNGRLVSDADMRSRQRHQRIRGSEFNQYREKLRQNHNISHPDSYYGMKPRPKRQIQQRPKQTEQRPQWGQQQPQQSGQRPQVGQQRPQQAGQRPQWGQKQPQQVQQKPQLGQQPPQQTRQRYQQEQQKLQQERQKKTKERLKKSEQEREPKQGQEERTKRPPR